MTYSMRGFGAFENCSDFYSGGIDYCLGYERSCPDHEKCCPPDGWYNAVYQDIKGKVSLRRQNEEKIRHAMSLLLAPTQSGFATGLEQMAYDSGVQLNPALVQRVATAATTFDLVFPRERFRYASDKEKAPDHGLADGVRQCGGKSHTYSGYYMEVYWPEARIVAVEALTGVSFSPAQRAQLQKGGLAAAGDQPKAALALMLPGSEPLEAPANVAAVFDKVEALILTAPGCRLDQYRDTMPTVADLVTVGSGRGAGVALSPWLEGFVAALTPTQSLASRFPGLVGKIPKPPGLRAPWLPPTEVNEEGGSGRMPSRSPGASSSGLSTGAKVGIAVVGLGVGYAVLRAVT